MDFRQGKRPGMPLADRLARMVDKSGGPEACWPFLGRRSSKGYGSLRVDGKNVYAHRLAYELAKGPLPPEKPFACHSCDNPPCCNDAHLFPGTNADNLKDAVAKGYRPVSRFGTGLNNPNGRLSPEQVRQLPIMRASGMTLRAIAEYFDVSIGAVTGRLRRMSCQ
jgi:hypothetical protein